MFLHSGYNLTIFTFIVIVYGGLYSGTFGNPKHQIPFVELQLISLFILPILVVYFYSLSKRDAQLDKFYAHPVKIRETPLAIFLLLLAVLYIGVIVVSSNLSDVKLFSRDLREFGFYKSSSFTFFQIFVRAFLCVGLAFFPFLTKNHQRFIFSIILIYFCFEVLVLGARRNGLIVVLSFLMVVNLNLGRTIIAIFGICFGFIALIWVGGIREISVQNKDLLEIFWQGMEQGLISNEFNYVANYLPNYFALWSSGFYFEDLVGYINSFFSIVPILRHFLEAQTIPQQLGFFPNIFWRSLFIFWSV